MNRPGLKDWEDMTKAEKIAFGALSTRSLLNFTRMWFQLIRGEHLILNWHHRVFSEVFEKMVTGQILDQSLIINVPPGSTKTEYFSIHAPLYCLARTLLGNGEKYRNLNLSYTDSLVKRNSNRTRDVIKSAEFQELFQCTFGVSEAVEWNIVDSKKRVIAETVSRSMGGAITGGRGGFYGDHYSGAIVLDDPDKPEDMFSAVKREAQHRKIINTVRSRRGDRTDEHPTPFLLIQQRLHELDSTSVFTSGRMGVNYQLISIPAAITEEYIDSLPQHQRDWCWKDIKGTKSIVKSGVRYWSYFPKLESIDNLMKLWNADDYTFLSQYQQDPPQLAGSLFDVDWFVRYDQLPVLTHRAVYVDTNSGKITDVNDYTVFMLVGLGVDNKLYILEVRRGKWSPKELQEQAAQCWSDWSPFDHKQPMPLTAMYIEDKQAGQGLIVDLENNNPEITVIPVPRGSDDNKIVRFNNIQPRLKAGHVCIPKTSTDMGATIGQTFYADGTPCAKTDWVAPFVTECGLLTIEILMDKVSGPMKKDDQVDVMMDAILFELIQGVTATTYWSDSML